MRRNVNSFRELFIISLPALGSLLMAGVAILFTQPIMACLWPTIERPDINTCISCYLAPAGLVYALSFGFMFQQALEKHNSSVDKVRIVELIRVLFFVCVFFILGGGGVYVISFCLIGEG